MSTKNQRRRKAIAWHINDFVNDGIPTLIFGGCMGYFLYMILRGSA